MEAKMDALFKRIQLLVQAFISNGGAETRTREEFLLLVGKAVPLSFSVVQSPSAVRWFRQRYERVVGKAPTKRCTDDRVIAVVLLNARSPKAQDAAGKLGRALGPLRDLKLGSAEAVAEYLGRNGGLDGFVKALSGTNGSKSGGKNPHGTSNPPDYGPDLILRCSADVLERARSRFGSPFWLKVVPGDEDENGFVELEVDDFQEDGDYDSPEADEDDEAGSEDPGEDDEAGSQDPSEEGEDLEADDRSP